MLVIHDILYSTGIDFRLSVFEDGDEILRRFRDTKQPCPDLVLLDLNIPRVSGLEVLQALRDSTHCGRVRVIVVTSSESTADRRAVERLQGDAYFSKPGDLTEYQRLGELIQQVLEAPAGDVRRPPDAG